MTYRAVIAAMSFAMLAGCAGRGPAPSSATVAAAEPAGWRAIASATDQTLIDTAAARWTAARSVVGARLVRKLSAEGALVEAGAAQVLPALPPGPYHCRLLRFGGRAGFASYKPDLCFVQGDAAGVTFTKATGANLPGGWIYPDTDKRQILLGSMRKTPGEGAAAYGTDPATSVAGSIERVSPMRWRLTLNRAGRGALLDVYELVPVPPAVPGALEVVAGPA